MDPFTLPQVILPMLCDHLRSLGFEASVVEQSKSRALWPGRDVGFVDLVDGPVDQVSVTMPGLSSMRMSNWSHLWSVGKLPISGRKVWPVVYNYLLRAPGLVVRRDLKAQFRGADKAPRWSGGRLAEVLSADAALAEALAAELGPQDRLSVRGDPPHQLLRIVHETRRLVGFALLPKPKLDLEGGWPSRELVDALGGVAGKARAFL